MPPVTVPENVWLPRGMRLRNVTGTVVDVVDPPRAGLDRTTIAPLASPGCAGVRVLTWTATDLPGASVAPAGVTVPNDVYLAALTPNTTGPM